MKILSLLCSFAIFSLNTAFADEAADLRAKAYQYYQQGKSAFQEKRFREALARFEQANVLDPSPTLVYNIARSHEELGDARSSTRYYELFLELSPNDPDRPEVEHRVRVMNAIMEKEASEVYSLRPWAIASATAGAAMLIAGTIAGVQVRNYEDDQRGTNNPAKKADYADKAQVSAVLSNIGFVAGGAFITAAGALFLIDWLAPIKTEDPAVLSLNPTGVSFNFRF